MVVALPQHDGRLVSAGRRRGPGGPAHQYEPRLGVLRVVDLGLQGLQAVPGGRELAREGGVVLALLDQPRGVRVGGGRLPVGVREVFLQPVAYLRLGGRMRGDRLDVRQFRAGPDQQREGDRQQHLAVDHQRCARDQLVERGRDPALDGVLDRHEGGLGLACAHRVERGLHGHVRDQLPGRGLGKRAQGDFGEGAFGAEIGIARWHDLTLMGLVESRVQISPGRRMG